MNSFKLLIIASTMLIGQLGFTMTHGQPVTAANHRHKSAVYLASCSATKIGDRHFLLASHCLSSILSGDTYRKADLGIMDFEAGPEARTKKRRVAVKTVFLRDEMKRNDVVYGKPTSKKLAPFDIAVVEIEEETPSIPVQILQSPGLLQVGDRVSFTCFGRNEVGHSETTWSDRWWDPRTGIQGISKITPEHAILKPNAFSQNLILPVDSGCGMYSETDEIVAIASFGILSRVKGSKEEKFTSSTFLLIAPHFSWLQSVLDDTAPRYRIFRYYWRLQDSGGNFLEP